MGFLDKLKKHGPGLKDKASDLVAEHNDKVDDGLDKAAGYANSATDGKFDDQIDAAVDKVKDAADDLAETAKDDPPATPGTTFPRNP